MLAMPTLFYIEGAKPGVSPLRGNIRQHPLASPHKLNVNGEDFQGLTHLRRISHSKKPNASPTNLNDVVWSDDWGFRA